MFTLIFIEFKKLKRSKIMYIAICTLFLFSLCVSIQSLTAAYSAERIMKQALAYGTFLILPALLSLIGSYIISREEQDDTMKSLVMIPIKYDILVAAKLITTLIIGICLSLLLFSFTLISQIVINAYEITTALVLTNLIDYLLQGIGCFMAVAPIISFMTIFKNGHWLSVIFTEIYSLAGLFVTSSKYRGIYPISAVFGFSRVSVITRNEYLICCLSLLVSAVIAWLIISFKRNFKS